MHPTATASDALGHEARARAVLPDYGSACYATGAGAGDALLEGIADWSAFRFRPRADLRQHVGVRVV